MEIPEWLPVVGEGDSPDDPFVDRAARWAVDLSYRGIPKPVRRAAKAQLTSSVGAAIWTQTDPIGDRIVDATTSESKRGNSTFLGGDRLSPADAAVGNAALSGAFGFDDTLVGGATSPSCVFVPLAYAEVGAVDGETFLAAQIAANEIAARLGAATVIGPFSGPNAAWIHAAGAAVGRAIVEGDDRETLADALASALSGPSRPIDRSTLGSDAGVWTASGPIRTGIAAVDSARAGISGKRDVVEGEGGVLAAVSPSPATKYLCALGERWHTASLSIRTAPGGVYVAAPAEAALEVRGRFDRGRTSVESVDVYGVHATVSLDAKVRSYIDDGESIAASMSVPRAVATALVTGELTPKAAGKSGNGRAVERVADRVTVHHDPTQTVAALRSTPPDGVDFTTGSKSIIAHTVKALGPSATLRALPAVIRASRRLSRPPSEFERRIGARLAVRTADGRTFEASLDRPSGVAGAPPAEVRAVARKKCRSGLRARGFAEAEARQWTERLLAIDELETVEIEDIVANAVTSAASECQNT